MLEPIRQRALVIRDARQSAETRERHPGALKLRFAAGLVSPDVGHRSRRAA
jgi:hypothetical protein